MFRLLLAFSPLVVVPSASTFVSVSFLLKCPYSFTYSISLWENDPITPDDKFAQFTGDAEGEYDGKISGHYDGDWPTDDYEFYLFIEHNCIAEERKLYRSLGPCGKDKEKCIYPKQIVDLTIA